MTQLYDALTNWVEKGTVPERLEVKSFPGPQGAITQPVCPYPQKATFIGGNPRVTTSFVCR